MRSPRLILASASPRRRELLERAGFTFDVRPADVDEDNLPPEKLPADVAVTLARRKATAIAIRLDEPAVVLAADTVVAFGDTSIGKPRDADHARRMMTLLAGTTHIVVTGVCVINADHRVERAARVMSAVRMKPLTAGQINAYVQSGNWEGKAGGYGIQDDDPFVTHLSGCRTNIVGLPMTTTTRLLADAGVKPDRS